MASSAVKIPFTEAAAPATPATGEVVVYAKTDGLVYCKDDAGTETLMASGSAGAVATDAIWDAAGDLAVGSGANTAARLAIGATNGMAVQRVSGAVAWALPPGYEFDYVGFASDVSVTGTNEAGAQTVVTSSSVAYDGSTVVNVEFFAPGATQDTTANRLIDIFLLDGSTVLGIIARVRTPANGITTAPVHSIRRITPSAASHTFTVKAYVSAGTGTVHAGNGTTGNWAGGFIRVTKV